MSERIEVLGVAFDNITIGEAVSRGMALMTQRNAAYVVTPNPEIVWRAGEDAALNEALQEASLVLPDGIGVILGAKILGTPLREKVPGIDFASALLEQMAAKGMSVFLFGSKPGVAEKAGEKLLERYPGLVLAGTENGYFQDDTAIVEHIQAVGADLLLVCLGAPKQETWMKAHAGKLPVGLMAGLGGALDVFSGQVQRAPKIWQKLGLEWLHRLLKEPKRIGRMKALPLFLLKVIGQRGKRGK